MKMDWMKQAETRMDGQSGKRLRQIQVEASCYQAECTATRKAIKEECDHIVNFIHKLNDLLILMSKKFQISLLVEPFSKSTAEPILPEVGILPVISSLQQKSD